MYIHSAIRRVASSGGLVLIVGATLVGCSTPTAVPTTTTTPARASEAYLNNLCARSADLCKTGTATKGAVLVQGQTVCTSLKAGAPITAALDTENVVARKTGVNPKDGIVIVTAAVNELCPKYVPALDAYVRQSQN